MGRITFAEEKEIDPPPNDLARLAALAEAQLGAFTTAQALTLGVSGPMLTRALAQRRLFRVHRGVYSIVPPRLLRERGRQMAAVLANGPGAGLSHITAARHTGFLSGSAPRTLDVTVPSHAGRKRPGLRIHRSTLLRPTDVEAVYGIPTTTVARTLLDLCGVMSAEQVGDAMDEAARMELLGLKQLREQVRHNRGRPEAVRLAEIVATWDYLNAFTDTQLEKLVLQGLLSAGLPRPELQQWLDLSDGGKRIRADFLYREARLILEADGWRWHAHRFEQDSRRDQRAAAAGFQTLRLTRRQVVLELDRLMATVAAVHAQRCAMLGAAGKS